LHRYDVAAPGAALRYGNRPQGGIVRITVAASRATSGALLLALAGLVGACGGGDEPAGAAATTAAPVATTAGGAAAPGDEACADAAVLQQSLARLDQLDVPEAGKAGLQGALQEVRTDLAALEQSSGGRWAGQVRELDTAIDGFQATVAGLDENLLDDLPTIVGNLERVERALTALDREIDQACPAP
jgi:hypothetical protein